MKKRGRPTKKATAKDKKKVKELLAEDAPVTEIAALLKLSVPTFRKLFAAELISGKKKKATAAKYKITKRTAKRWFATSRARRRSLTSAG